MATRRYSWKSRCINVFTIFNEGCLIKDKPLNTLIINYLLITFFIVILWRFLSFSSNSQFYFSLAYIFILFKRSPALVGRLYLFTSYALRFFLAFRYLKSYLGIIIHIVSQLKLQISPILRDFLFVCYQTKSAVLLFTDSTGSIRSR